MAKVSPALAVIVGIALRLPGLTSKPLWYDEAFSLLLASQDLPAILRGTMADVHPPGYYLLLHFWLQLFGSSALSGRLFSLACGIGVILLGYSLALRWVSPRMASAAAWALALSPFQVHYAQEIRMYALLALLLLGATVLLWDSLQFKDEWRWISLTLLVALAQYTHNLALFYLLPLILVPMLKRQWSRWLTCLLAVLGALVLYLPWGYQVIQQLTDVDAAYWIDKPDLQSLVRTYLVFVGGLPVPENLLPILLFSSLLAGAFAVYLAVRMLRESARAGRGWLWAFYLSAVPVVLLYAASQVWPIYLERGLIASGAALMIGMGIALSNEKTSAVFRVSGWIALLFAFGLGLWGYHTYRGFPYAPFEELNAELQSKVNPGEIALHSSKLSALPAAVTDSWIDHRYLSDPSGAPTDTLSATTQAILGFEAEESFEAAVDSKPGVWLIVFSREIEEYQQMGYRIHPIRSQLREWFTEEDHMLIGSLELYHYH